MAEGILGLGGGGSAGLSNEVIDKLKAAERRASVEPLEKKLEDWDLELEQFSGIEAKVSELLNAVKPFDLFYSGANVFEQMSASTNGDSAIFDAVDVGSLIPGTVNVSISQLAQKDVFQSNAVTEAIKDTALGAETLSIQIGTNPAVDFDTTGKTYQELSDEINRSIGLTASIESVGIDSYRLIIKSTDSGTDNALTITGTASQTLGYTTDGTTENAINHKLTAQNMKGTIDNIDYDVSSNTVTTQGNLSITAVAIGDSSISIQRDTSTVVGSVDNLLTKYNELVDLVEAEVFSADSPVEDIGSLKLILSSIKDKLFGTYGAADDKNIFNYGFELDKAGHISLDTEVFADALNDDYAGVAELFIGVAEKKGLGTQLKELMDDFNGYDGLLTRYGEGMLSRKETIEEDKKVAIEDLDAKYLQLSMQFASYGTIIAQMEASFSGMKMMIEQSTNG